MRCRRLVASSEVFVSLAEAKDFLKISSSLEDATLVPLMAAVQAYIEQGWDLALFPQTWEVLYPLDRRETFLPIPKHPLRVLESVHVVDRAGEAVALAQEFWEDHTALHGGIALHDGFFLRYFPLDKKVVAIRFQAGFGTPFPEIPPPIRQAYLLLLAHWYEERSQTSVPNSVVSLLLPFKNRLL